MSNRKKLKLPAPGLDGSYRDTCIVCFTPTDTGLGFRGEAEWCIAGIRVLGVPEDHAYPTFREGWIDSGHELGDGEVPDGVIDVPVRVCAGCVSKCPADFPAPVLAVPGAALPTISPADGAA